MSFSVASLLDRCCGPESPCYCAGAERDKQPPETSPALVETYPRDPVSLVEAWWLTRLDGDADATAAYCSDDVEWMLPAWSTPLQGIGAVSREVFAKPAPPVTPENLLTPFRVEEVAAGGRSGTAVVVRDVRVKLGHAVFVVRQEWMVTGVGSRTPKIARMSVTKLAN